MKRLIADAAKLTDSQEKLGVAVDANSMSFDNVVNAISVMQDHMGIAGATANEAATTFSGSFASMKAAFSDLLANLSTGRNIGPALTALGETIFTFVQNNLLPMVGNIFAVLPETLSSLLGMAIQGLNLVADNTDAILKIGADLVVGLGDAILTALPLLLEAAWNIVMALGTAIVTTDWIQIATDAITALCGSLDEAAQLILGTDENIVGAINDAIFSGFDTLLEIGGQMVVQLIDGLSAVLPDLLEAATSLCTDFLNKLISRFPDILDTGSDILSSIISGIQVICPQLLRSAGEIISELISGISQNLPSIIQSGFNLIVTWIEGIGNAYPDIIDAAFEMCASIWDSVKEIDWIQLGKDIIQGLINGIGAMGNALWTAARNIANSCLNAIKKALGIASPSKVMAAEVGKWIPPGVAVGAKGNTKPLTDAMHSIAAMSADTLKTDLDMAGMLASSAATLTVTGAPSAYASTQGSSIEQILESLENLSESNLAGHTASVQVLRELLETLLNINIGDDVIGRSVDRYNQRRARMGGVI